MDELERLRDRIDSLDDEIAARLAQRFEAVRRIGELKRDERIPVMQIDRIRHVHQKYRQRGDEQGMPAAFTQAFVDLLLTTTCEMEEDIIGRPGEIELDRQ